MLSAPHQGFVHKIRGIECTWGLAQKFVAPTDCVRNEQKSRPKCHFVAKITSKNYLTPPQRSHFWKFSSIENWNVSNLYVKQLERLEEVESAQTISLSDLVPHSSHLDPQNVDFYFVKIYSGHVFFVVKIYSGLVFILSKFTMYKVLFWAQWTNR